MSRFFLYVMLVGAGLAAAKSRDMSISLAPPAPENVRLVDDQVPYYLGDRLEASGAPAEAAAAEEAALAAEKAARAAAYQAAQLPGTSDDLGPTGPFGPIAPETAPAAPAAGLVASDGLISSGGLSTGGDLVAPGGDPGSEGGGVFIPPTTPIDDGGAVVLSPTPTNPILPAAVQAAITQADTRIKEYLLQRGWKTHCDAPGGYWLWQKTIAGQTYRMNRDEAMNVEFVVHFAEIEAALVNSAGSGLTPVHSAVEQSLIDAIKSSPEFQIGRAHV